MNSVFPTIVSQEFDFFFFLFLFFLFFFTHSLCVSLYLSAHVQGRDHAKKAQAMVNGPPPTFDGILVQSVLFCGFLFSPESFGRDR